ncbi:hypothetical protein ABPG72_012290 [Tetrahymena utriculariae]
MFENQYEDSFWSQTDKIIRRILYNLFHEIQHSQTVSPLIYKILLLIEGLQIAFFAINTSFSFLWSSSMTNVIQQAIQYFQINGPIQKHGQTIFLMILYIVISINLITLLVALQCSYSVAQKHKKSSSLFNYFIKYLWLYGLFTNTIGYIPMINIYLSTFYCNSSTDLGMSLECYKQSYFIHLSIAIFGFIIFAVLQTIFYKLYIDLNPCSKNPYAHPQSINDIIKLVLKTALPIYTTFDPEGVYGKALIICLGIYLICMVSNRFFCLPYYSKNIQNFTLIIDSSLLWIVWISFVCAIVDSGSISILYIFTGIPFISISIIFLMRYKESRVLSQTMKHFKKDTDFEYYLTLVIGLIENRSNPEDCIQLDGALKFHARYCTKISDVNCNCQSLILDKEDNIQIYQNNTNQINLSENIKWYNFVKFLLLDSFDKFQKSTRLHLFNSYIQHAKLNNKFKSLLELMYTSELKPNMQEEFSIYSYNHIIEDELKENDLRNTENKTIEVNSIIQFQAIFVDFLGSLEKSVNYYQEFWNKLLEEIPDVDKLLLLGTKITNSFETNQQVFENLQEINSNHIKTLLIYGHYLKEIVNDEQDGSRLLEKAQYIQRGNQANKQFVDVEKLKYGENSTTSVISVSGNLNQIGIVVNTNNEIEQLLSYSKNDLMGQNISKIMPKVYGDIHDGLFHRYLETSQPKVIGIERTVMCLNKNGYVIPTSIMVKVLPNLDQGIQIVGFLKEIDNQESKSQIDKDQVVHYIIYREDNLQIQGISQSIHDYFGIPSQLVYGNSNNISDFTIDQIMPGVADIANKEEMMSAQGLVTTIDSTYVQMNYLIEEENGYQESDLESQAQKYDNQQINQELENGIEKKKYKKFRQAQIKANLIIEQEFDLGLKVNVISFTETDSSTIQAQDNNIEEHVFTNNNKTIIKGEAPFGKDEQKSQTGEHQNGEYDDESSNIPGESVNDDQRQLKDFKTLISEKTIPKKIKILNRTALLLLLILCGLSAYDLGFKTSNESTVTEGLEAIQSGYILSKTLSTSIYYSNMLYKLANNLITPPAGQTADDYANGFRNNLSTSLNNLKDQMYNMIKHQISMYNNQNTNPPNLTITIQKMSSQGTLSSDQETLTDSLLTFINSGSTFQMSPLASIVKGQVNQATSSLYYINSNGLQSQREACNKTANEFFNYYYNKIDDFRINYIVVLSIAIVFVVISLFILIPIVFQVNRTNHKVLSLFGYIPYPEIRQLADKCGIYIQEYISIRGQEHFDSQDNKDENQNEGKEEVIDGENNQNNSEYIKSIDNGTDKNNTAVHTLDFKKQERIRSMEEKNHEHIKNNQDKKAENQNEDHEFIDHRSNLLLNQKDGSKKSVILIFGFVGALFILQYVIHFILDLQYIDKVQNIYSTLQLSCLLPSYTKWNLLFSQMQIQNGAVVLDTSSQIDLAEFYSQKIYITQNLFSYYYSYSFPRQMSTYQTQFQQAQTQNICTLINNINSNDQATCTAVNNGILKSGLITAVVYFTVGLRTSVSGFMATNLSDQQKLAFLTSTSFQQLQIQQSFMVSLMDQLTQLLVQQVPNYLSYRTTIEIIVFCLYIIVILASFVFIWLPYMARINVKIWRTKGMLNMIPVEVIQKHESLKNAFLHGEILSAVK